MSPLTFDQQLQLVQLQKEKLELELKVLERHDTSTKDSTASQNPQQSIDWPQDFIPSVQGEYDNLDLSEFALGFLLMINGYEAADKEALLSKLELMMTKSISY